MWGGGGGEKTCCLDTQLLRIQNMLQVLVHHFVLHMRCRNRTRIGNLYYTLVAVVVVVVVVVIAVVFVVVVAGTGKLATSMQIPVK